MLVLTFLAPKTIKAQVLDTSHKIDTLTTKDRLSIRTNALEWLLLVPNIGIEYDLKNVNYNRLSIGLNLRYNWETSHTFKPGVVYNVAEARLEVRNYYRMRQLSNYVERKKKIWDRLLSPRREQPKHPSMTYYRGGFLAYNKSTIKLGDEGHQGNAIIGGVMFGLIKPLYEFRNGHSLDFELGVAVGVAYASYDTFNHDAYLDYYPKTGHKTTIMPVVNDLRVGFVYRIGKYPLVKKYRWRYDVDMNYQRDFDNSLLEKRNAANSKAFSDSLDAYARKLFWEKYDSVAKHNKVVEDSLRRIGQDEKSLQKAKKAEEKAAKKAEEKATKEAEKPKQEAEGKAAEAPKQEAEAPKQEAEAPKQEAEEPKQEGGKP